MFQACCCQAIVERLGLIKTMAQAIKHPTSKRIPGADTVDNARQAGRAGLELTGTGEHDRRHVVIIDPMLNPDRGGDMGQVGEGRERRLSRLPSALDRISMAKALAKDQRHIAIIGKGQTGLGKKLAQNAGAIPAPSRP